jgi:hypothetical protein
VCIADILEGTFSAAEACRELVVSANLAGGADSITVVVARVGQLLSFRTEDEATDREAPTVFQPDRQLACCA